ncbi:hypothetical protein TNCT_188481 [Trichonephila clavata]|uniref:Uncharacterized protein n=1 Tax=Trichonephila clavata TaxID=2740835 RepID=A0A8X6KLW4_TRICU|nr:hypothetical protein TNCT_188481 [Trichonephila clavata]
MVKPFMYVRPWSFAGRQSHLLAANSINFCILSKSAAVNIFPKAAKQVVTPDEIEQILTNKELGDEFSDASSGDEGENNRQKQDLAPGGEKTTGNKV